MGARACLKPMFSGCDKAVALMSHVTSTRPIQNEISQHANMQSEETHKISLGAEELLALEEEESVSSVLWHLIGCPCVSVSPTLMFLLVAVIELNGS